MSNTTLKKPPHPALQTGRSEKAAVGGLGYSD